jgi:hypothetical protein
LDYSYYLPIFVEGIREKEDPHRFLAIQGVLDLIDAGRPDQVVPVIPQLIIPLKTALNTRDRDVMCVALKVIQHLVTVCDGAADALVRYFRQLLPIFNIFRNSNENLGDAIAYGQRKHKNVGDLISDTLAVIETNASPESQAFINIKYMIPTYESCMFVAARPVEEMNSTNTSMRARSQNDSVKLMSQSVRSDFGSVRSQKS